MTTATLNDSPATGFDSLYAWLQGADLNKLASEIPSESEHDDGGKPATTGARSSENDADVKKITNGNAIPGGTANSDGKMNNPVEGSGLNQSTTGHNPEVERAIKSVKGEEEKMAAADLNTDEGFKAAYDALVRAQSHLPVLLAHCGLDVSPAEPAKSAAAQPPAAPADHTPVDPTAAALGYASKEAADKAAAELVYQYQKLGHDKGHMTAQYLRGYDETMALLTKMADDGSLEAAAQGGQGPAPAIDPNAGAPPAMGGGDPAAAMQQGAAGPEGGAEGGQGGELSIEEVIAALQEMGITPEQLQQIIGQAQGGVQATPDAAAPPEEKAAAMAALNGWNKMAAEMTPYMRSGKYSLKPAADGTKERERRNAAKDYIRELQKFGGN